MAIPEESQPLIATLKRAAFQLKETGIPFCLAGGFAVYARGGESVDHDIDFLIREEDAGRTLTALAEVGFRCEVPPEGWLVKAWRGDVLVDLIYEPRGGPVTDAWFERSDELDVYAVTMHWWMRRSAA